MSKEQMSDLDKSNYSVGGLTVEKIAEFLLQENLTLTALEFYTECAEAGKEISVLETYFSDPSNFESVSKQELNGNLYRSNSVSTFDSLDIARCSDDGMHNVDDKIAVLEFELRKAKETIESLRNNLTNSIETSTNTKQYADPSEPHEANLTTVTPLEKRAINYVISEYLVNYDYTLSSITFADENTDQDFESWEDVGLNSARPPDLLKMYHYYNHQNTQPCNKCSLLEKELNDSMNVMTEKVNIYEKSTNDFMDQIKELQLEIEDLKAEKKQLEKMTHPMEISQTLHPETEVMEKLNKEITVVPPYKNEGGKWTMFWNDLLKHDFMDKTWIDSEIEDLLQTPGDLVNMVNYCIPQLVSSVVLAKRDLLAPILLSDAILQPDPEARNYLLQQLFSLIKRPTENQRRIIVHCFACYAKIVGTQQTVEELLPLVWEQLNHKYFERRIMVAMAVGAIAPYVSKDMVSSLLLSILQQMQQEESTEEVKTWICKSLAVIVSLLEDDSKYHTVHSMMTCYLEDGSAYVRLCTRSSLLPCVALWCANSNTLQTTLCKWLLSRFNETFKSSLFVEYCEDIKIVSFHLFIAIMNSMPISNVHLKSDEIKSIILRLPGTEYVHCDAIILMGDEESLAKRLSVFCDLLEKDVYEDCTLITWMFEELLTNLFEVLCNVHSKYTDVVHAFTKLFECLCLNFGEVFTAIVADKFGELFTPTMNSALDNKAPLLTAAYPVYLCGVLAVMEPPESNCTRVATMLSETIVLLASNNAQLDSIVSALLQLRESGYYDLLLDILSEISENTSHLVRSACAIMLQYLISEDVNKEIISNKVMPLLVGLAHDRDQQVKNSSIVPLCVVAGYPHVAVPIIQDVISILQTLYGDTSTSHETSLMLVQNLSKVAPKSHPKFQQELALPILAEIAMEYNEGENTTKKADIYIELLKAYTNLSCCFFSADLLRNMFLPGLKSLENDLEDFHPECMDSLLSLINEIEMKTKP